MKTAWDRFIPKVEITEGCWNWLAAKGGRQGHAIFVDENDKHASAYRWLWEQMYGPLPKDIELDHLCRNPSCVNPDHLEPVTRKTNQRRGFGFAGLRSRQTHCIRGHEFNAENTHIAANGTRHCKPCNRLGNRRRRAKRLCGTVSA